MDGCFLPLSGGPKASSGAPGMAAGSVQPAGPNCCSGAQPRLPGDFCSEAAVAGAPRHCQPRSNLMPKSSGFIQRLNLNLGKEKEERRASLIARLLLNPLLLSRAVLAGGICGHGEQRGPALGTVVLCKRVCVGFQIPDSLQPGFAGAGGMEEFPMLPGLLAAPQNLGCCLVPMNHPMVPRQGDQSSAWRSRSVPKPRTAARPAPPESPLALSPAQPDLQCGGRTDPQRGERSSLGLSCPLGPRLVQTPERCCVALPPAPTVTSSDPALVEKGCWSSRGQRCPAEPPGCMGAPRWARSEGRDGTRGTRAAGRGDAVDKVKQSAH